MSFVPSKNKKKSHDALNPQRARLEEMNLRRDLEDETMRENYEGEPGLTKNPGSAGTQGRYDKEERGGE